MTLAARSTESALSPVLYRYHPGLTVVRGEGSYLWTDEGQRLFDLTSGIATTVVGHAHPEVVEAVREQAGRLFHICGAVATPDITARYADELVARMPAGLESVFFCNSGAEAVEGALKMASFLTRRPAYVAFTGSFHGRTLGATSVTGNKEAYRSAYEPLRPSVHFLPFPRTPNAAPSIAALRELTERLVAPDRIAAIIVEPVQGEGGYYPAPSALLEELRRFTTEHGIMLIFDEVQTGFGRTGALFACQRYGVTPDVLVLAKSIANGMPLGAVVSSRANMDAWAPGTHGSTYGGNPVSCAAASATLEVIVRDGLASRAEAIGERVRDVLTDEGLVGQGRFPLRRLGAMVALDLGDPSVTSGVLSAALLENVLLLSCGAHGEVLRFMPALTVDLDELEVAVRRVARITKAIVASRG